jgi:two-component system response regulator FixJ
MPHRSGLEVLKQLNARQYGAPVVVMSAQADIPIAVDAIKSGAST